MKIHDKISLRTESLRLAVNSCIGRSVAEVLNSAKAFEMYIQGEVELPDFMPVPDHNVSVNVCNGCNEEYDDEEDGIGLN